MAVSAAKRASIERYNDRKKEAMGEAAFREWLKATQKRHREKKIKELGLEEVRRQGNIKAKASYRRNIHKRRCQSHMTLLKKKYPDALLNSDVGTSSLLYEWYTAAGEAPCVFCGSPGESVDHIIPLSKSGMHHSTNLRLLCKKCNIMRKNDSDEVFVQHIKAIANYYKETLNG